MNKDMGKLRDEALNRALSMPHGKKRAGTVAENRSDQELRIEAILPVDTLLLVRP